MTIEQDFLPFANGVGANVLNQAAYAALTSLLANGFSAGTAQSVQLNKVWRQSSIMSSVLAQFIVNQTGQPAIDDGTTATLLSNLATAVAVSARQNPVLADTGTVNNYAVANLAAFTAYPTASGLVIDVSIANANTGASTLNVDGLGTKPILGLGLLPLQGGELIVKGVASLLYVVASTVNSGNGAWVVMECTGGAQQVAPATQSGHAMQLGQATGRWLATQVFQASGTYTPTPGTRTVHIRAAAPGGGGGGCATTGASTVAAATGGTSGGYCELWAPSIPSQTITIGAPGSAGPAGAGSSGGNGGNTLVGSLITLIGGNGGKPSGAGTPPFILIPPNATTGNTVTVPGQTLVANLSGVQGSPGIAMNAQATNCVNGGGGGSNPIGVGQALGFGAGVQGSGFGYGGGGAALAPSSTQVAGAAGGPGIVIIEEYA
jgi:hypothetical protein